jgi:hypothetical protein
VDESQQERSQRWAIERRQFNPELKVGQAGEECGVSLDASQPRPNVHENPQVFEGLRRSSGASLSGSWRMKPKRQEIERLRPELAEVFCSGQPEYIVDQNVDVAHRSLVLACSTPGSVRRFS